MRALLLGLMLVVSIQSAEASLSERELQNVAIVPPPHASIPINLIFRNMAGLPILLGDAIAHRPALLFLVDFTCRTVCGPELAIASGALGAAGLRPGVDYDLVVVGLDPKDTINDAKGILAQIDDPSVLSATTILTGNVDTIRILTEAVGYRFSYDQQQDQFAHPAAAMVVTSNGQLSRVLSGLALNALDLRLAIVEAGHGKVGSLTDRLTLLCYGFDAAHGVYTLIIWHILEICTAATVIALAIFIIMLNRRGRLAPFRRSS